MASSSSTPQPQPSPGADGPRRTGGKLTLLGATGLLVLVGAFGAWLFLVFFYTPKFDPSPLKREKMNAPFITSPDPVVEWMVELAELSEDDVVYDLGCGDGRMVVTAALKSGCRGVGFDILPDCVAEATENVKAHGLEDRVTIEQADMFKVDLSPASVIMTYILQWMMNDLVPQFDQMKPGSRIIAHDFWIEGVEPDRVVEVMIGDEYLEPHSIFIYSTPLKRNPQMEKGRPPAPTERLEKS